MVRYFTFQTGWFVFSRCNVGALWFFSQFKIEFSFKSFIFLSLSIILLCRISMLFFKVVLWAFEGCMLNSKKIWTFIRLNLSLNKELGFVTSFPEEGCNTSRKMVRYLVLFHWTRKNSKPLFQNYLFIK